jgi:hypothetical protein
VVQIDLASPCGELGLVTPGNGCELRLQRVARSNREEGGTVTLAFAMADYDLASLDVDVLDADRQRLEQAKAAAVLPPQSKGKPSALGRWLRRITR